MAIALMAVAVLLILSLASYRPDDPVPRPLGQWTGEPVHNVAGIAGALAAALLWQLCGYAAWTVPPLMLLLGWEIFWRRSGRALSRSLGSLLFVLSAAGGMHLLLEGVPFPDTRSAGGWFGFAFAHLLARVLGRWGALVATAALVATSLLVVTRASIIEAARIVWSRAVGLVHSAWLAWVRHREARRKERLRLEIARRQQERRAAAAALDAETEPAIEPHAAAPIPLAALDGAPPAPAQGRAAAAAAPAARRTARIGAASKGKTEPAEGQPQFDFVATPATYTPPPLSLLNPPQHDVQVDEKELVETARLITEKCREFGVTGQVIAIQPGPVVTVFEFKPDAGVKYSKIVTLDDDLCLAIEAESIRIDRIAGKSTVGIEVPNKKRETISLRELLASERFQKASAPLTLALGKEINGEPYYADLARMPHLLVAGSTGSGKSVSLNTFLTSILYKSSPDEVKFIMIDPKRLELGVYENIPHLLCPLVTDTKKAANSLRWAVLEMERRYKQLAEAGVRGIDQYNLVARREAQERAAAAGARAQAGGPGPAAADAPAEGGAVAGSSPARAPGNGAEPLKPLPYVVIVIDELADLMMTTGAEVEEAITRLAQMARAVGIHLILSTQRPSVDIITGVIKANFPCRIAMRVSSKVDSRTILDSNGAEHLLGHGDMLFIPPGSARLIRLHGPLVTEVEATRIVSFLKKQAKPQYDESVTRDEPQGGPGGAPGRDEDVDPAYDQAVRLAIQMGQISVSHIQRRLKLGYARAARLVDMMEQNGIVGPADGSKPREVLVEPEFLERMSQMREEQT